MRLPSARKFFRRLFVLLIAGFCLFVIGAVVFTAKCKSVPVAFQPTPETSRHRPETAGIAGYLRGEDETFLTYPEWFIVWSYQEKADFQQNHLPSGFPFFGSIAQYWRGYCCANRIVRGRYPFNTGDHLMLAVIGSSFSVEYGLKGIYEETIGRFTEWLSGHEPVEEDVYAYQVAREYADFVHIRPFYEFHFGRSFAGLWKDTRLWGPHPVRKWERKLWLALDYGVEALYCGLIEKASHSVYGVEDDQTYAWIENATDSVLAANPRVRKVKEVGPQAYIVMIPRYQEFTNIVESLARQGVRFVQIAGNEQVALTVVVPRDRGSSVPGTEMLFSIGLLTQPGLQRVELRAPVSSLHTVLNAMVDRGVKVEHVYDF
ncbi:MAG TPA: hypothetical protein VKU19_08055 [Bryobacteraceae bacterium]|nr:hypothetical protein [Bryobacteraceae bacterium]